MTIGDLVVNLGLNRKPFDAGLQGARNNLQGFARGTLGLVGGLFGPLVAGFGAAVLARQAWTSALESIQAEQKLESVLTSTGHAAGLTGAELKALAGDLQSLTNFEDDATISAMAVLATFRRIKGDVFKDAIVSAQDMSAVLGTDLQSSVIMIGKALNDPTRGITAMSRAGITFTQSQQDMIRALQKSGDILGAQRIIMQELQAEFGGAAKAMADPFTQLQHVAGDVLETIGVGARQLFAPMAQSATEFVSGVLPMIESGIDELSQFAQDAFSVIGFAIANVGTISQFVWKSAALSFVSFGSEVQHFFTGTLPALFQWFVGNWQKIWFTALDYTLTVLTNLGKNIRSFFAAVWEFISSGGTSGFKIDWTPLTDGFRSALDELPHIPPRAIGELERSLTNDVNKLGTQLGDSLGQTMLDSWAKQQAKAPAVLPGAALAGFSEAGAGGRDKANRSSATSGPAALRVGTAESISAIVKAGNAQREARDNLQRKQNDLAKKQLDELKKMNQRLAGLEQPTFEEADF